MDDFERSFSRMAKFMVAFWALTALASLGLVGVIAWGIIALVQHFAG